MLLFPLRIDEASYARVREEVELAVSLLAPLSGARMGGLLARIAANFGRRILTWFRCLALMTSPAASFRVDGSGPFLLGCSSFEGFDDPHVAHHDGQGIHERVLGQTEQAAPTPADSADGGIRHRGVRALGRGASSVRDAKYRSRIGMFLPGLFVDLWRDGDALLRATPRWLARRVRHAWVVEREG